jgi:hypothetical protein
MTHVPGSTFGFGATSGQSVPWGLSPYGGQGFGLQPTGTQPFVQPFSTQFSPGYGISQPAPVQQILQALQIVPQQLQQLQANQQQQSWQLQLLLQTVPAQLQQLQQLIQLVPQQLQQIQQGQPFGSVISSPLGFGLPHVFGAQTPGHVM